MEQALKRKDLFGEVLLALPYHPDGDLSERAFSTLLDKRRDNALVLPTCVNNLLLDHEREGELLTIPT